MLLALILSTLTAHAKPMDPIQDPTSLVRLALSAEPNAVNANLSPDCKLQLRKTKHFPSNAVAKYLVLPSQWVGDATPDGVFYHYTNAEAVRTIVAEKRPQDIFAYLRQAGSTDPFMYLAGDPESSNEFGAIQIRVNVSTRSPIFVLTKKNLYGTTQPAPHSEPNQLWWTRYESAREEITQDINADVIRQTPALKACANESVSVQGFREFPLLMLLAIEGARIPLIAYYGTGKNWYMLMGTWAADSFTVGAP